MTNRERGLRASFPVSWKPLNSFCLSRFIQWLEGQGGRDRRISGSQTDVQQILGDQGRGTLPTATREARKVIKKSRSYYPCGCGPTPIWLWGLGSTVWMRARASQEAATLVPAGASLIRLHTTPVGIRQSLGFRRVGVPPGSPPTLGQACPPSPEASITSMSSL